jgi:hypothetical protein
MCNVFFQMDLFAVVKFSIDNTIALICKKWISKDITDGDEVCYCHMLLSFVKLMYFS